MPPHSLREQFQAQAEPVTNLVLNLGSATAALRRTRDLLLPKLVAGNFGR